MRLYEWETVRCAPLLGTATADGEGGYEITYREGEPFYASIRPTGTVFRSRGDKETALSTFTVSVSEPGVSLLPGAPFVAEDGRCFRVTSESRRTPMRSGFSLRQFEAEAWQKEETA